MQFTVGQLRQALLGTTRPTNDDGVVTNGVTQDSRNVTASMLFVPIVAERDGHDFIDRAVANGATAYLTSRGPAPGVDAVAIEVGDTATALSELGRAARGRMDAHVVGITGSVGKTSTKDLCVAVFGSRWITHGSLRSFNNEIGVPLTLLNTPGDAGAVVVEMGARGVGHIEKLCSIARPTVAIVTTVGAAHLELFGSVEQVAKAKAELVESLPDNGLAVLNRDDPRVAAMASATTARTLTVGLGQGADVQAVDVSLGADLRPRFTALTPWGSVEVLLGARGVHNVGNAVAAIGAAAALGAPLEAIAAALAEPILSPWRMQVERAPSGMVVINDAYNANPVSMRAALDALLAVEAEARFAVLGPMAELGSDGARAHAEIGAYAASRGIEVIAVGAEDYGAPTVATAAEALAWLAEHGATGAGSVVLVKASRIAALETMAEALVQELV